MNETSDQAFKRQMRNRELVPDEGEVKRRLDAFESWAKSTLKEWGAKNIITKLKTKMLVLVVDDDIKGKRNRSLAMRVFPSHGTSPTFTRVTAHDDSVFPIIEYEVYWPDEPDLKVITRAYDRNKANTTRNNMPLTARLQKIAMKLASGI